MSTYVARPSGSPPAARGRAQWSGRARAALAAGGCLAAAGGLTWAVMPSARREPVPAAASAATWSTGRAAPVEPAVQLRPMEPVRPPDPVTVVQPAVAAPVVVLPMPRVMGFWENDALAQQLRQEAAARHAREQAQRLAMRAASPSFTQVRAITASADPGVATPGPDGGEYARRMQTARFENAAPTPPGFHAQYTIRKGTTFPCAPSQPVSSELPGPVRCTVGQDVYSMDGANILLPRGTQVNGSVERGLAAGEERLFLVWTDALTPLPYQRVIPLDAPAADEMGQTGVPGDVNDHLWKRVRTALLLSAVDFVGQAATAVLRRGNGTTLNFGGVASTSSSLGQMAFGRDINIPPTLYRGPGQPLTVYVNKYVDLHKYYQSGRG